MWIRSQNKEVLMHADIFEISETYKNNHNIECHGYVLGKYSTKEKALKVLNDIEDTLYCLNGFYQMPKDDEVKVDE